MMQELAYQLQSQGLQMEQLFEITGENLEGLKEKRREEAEEMVRGSLVLEAIGEAEKIEATEEEINEEMANMAKMYGIELEEVKKALNAEDVAGQIKVRKTIEFLVENATIA